MNKTEVENLKSQPVISSWGGSRSYPYAFAEQGIAMLSSVLRSETAILVSIRIMDVFVAMRCGYRDANYLKNLFKSRVGMSMRAFRACRGK